MKFETEFGIALQEGVTHRLISRLDWDDGLELWCMMQNRADEDEIYASELRSWLRGENDSSTVFLRDVLASPFRKAFRNRENHLVFFNAWCAVDSARHLEAHKAPY